MSEEVTIKINKNSLWKYASFVLLAVVIILVIVMVAGNGSNGNTNVNTGTGGNTQPQGTGDFSFAEDEALYPSIGPENAETTVIAFFDFQCPYCAISAGLSPAATQYASAYGDLYGAEGKIRDLAKEGKIRFIFAIHSFLGPESGYAGEAALCANEQGKYPEMYDAIFTAHDMSENNGKYNKDKLKDMAKKISGISTSAFNTCLDSNKYATSVAQMAQNAGEAGVSGTPAFVINGQTVGGSWTQISAQLKALGVDTN